MTRRKKSRKKKRRDPLHPGRGISRKKQAALFTCFVLDQTASTAAKTAKVQHNTASLYYNRWREAIYSADDGRAPVHLEGEFEIDQRKFGGYTPKRYRSTIKRLKETLPYAEFILKYREIRERFGAKVIGIMRRHDKQVYTRIIQKEDKRTIQPLVRLVVAQGSTIYTDQWRGFADLKPDGYVHHAINHSVEFVDRHGHHANTIESFWSFAKRRLAKFNGLPKRTLPLHIKECEFRWNHRADLKKALTALVK